MTRDVAAFRVRVGDRIEIDTPWSEVKLKVHRGDDRLTLKTPDGQVTLGRRTVVTVRRDPH